jgi:SAM-dependent MidA family methyltransferase
MSHKGILLRKYLCKRLSDYYSQPANAVVGSIESASFTRKTIDFSSLINEWHWKRTYKKVYQEQKGMWLTPVELFFPYYSNILANFVSISMMSTMEKHNEEDEGVFDIVELGGGRGTNAVALLDHLRAFHPKVYDRLQSYTIFDTSPTLHKLQKDILLGNNGGSSHSDKVKLVNVDMMDIVEGK